MQHDATWCNRLINYHFDAIIIWTCSWWSWTEPSIKQLAINEVRAAPARQQRPVRRRWRRRVCFSFFFRAPASSPYVPSSSRHVFFPVTERDHVPAWLLRASSRVRTKTDDSAIAIWINAYVHMDQHVYVWRTRRCMHARIRDRVSARLPHPATTRHTTD